MPAPEAPSEPRPTTALGIDIGGSFVRLAVVDGAGRIRAMTRAPTPTEGDPQQLAATVAHLASEVSSDQPIRPAVAGAALPGVRDASGNVMQHAVNLPRLEGANVRELFERALRRPVHLDTDVNAAGWAQWRSLTPRPRRFVYLSIGTGVGGCVILDGQIVRHTHDGPGHLGHLIVDTRPDAPRCACGARGCLEASLGSTVRTDTAHETVRALAVALLQIAHLYAPNTIALGGGVVDHQPELVPRARAAFDPLRSTLVPRGMAIQVALLPTDQAGVIGATLLALDSIRST